MIDWIFVKCQQTNIYSAQLFYLGLKFKKKTLLWPRECFGPESCQGCVPICVSAPSFHKNLNILWIHPSAVFLLLVQCRVIFWTILMLIRPMHLPDVDYTLNYSLQFLSHTREAKQCPHWEKWAGIIVHRIQTTGTSYSSQFKQEGALSRYSLLMKWRKSFHI